MACGSRDDAYDKFKTAHENNKICMLLVDAEDSIKVGDKPWQHLNKRDGWPTPSNATEEQCHMMVLIMESWFEPPGEATPLPGPRPNRSAREDDPPQDSQEDNRYDAHNEHTPRMTPLKPHPCGPHPRVRVLPPRHPLPQRLNTHADSTLFLCSPPELARFQFPSV